MTPWVFDKGVPGVQHTAFVGRRRGPVFWDERYLEVQCGFIRKLGDIWMAGRAGFVDIGSIGEWGECTSHVGR